MKIKGYVDTASDHLVYGWAMDEERPEPVALKLLVNGEEVANLIANEPRQDLKDRSVHPTGCCGFSLFTSELPSDLPPNCKVQVKTVSGDVELVNSPVFPEIPASYFSDKSDERFFFIHVPKTAGTSFRFMLYELFRQRVIYPNLCDINRNNGYESVKEFRNSPKEKFREVQLLMAHIPSAAIELMPPGTHSITFLREPMARAISDINFRANENISSINNIEEIFEDNKYFFFNLQTRLFASDTIFKCPIYFNYRLVDELALKKAKANLEKTAFLGITERFEDSIRLAEKRFGWKFKKLKHYNMAKKKMTKDLPGYIWNEIKENNQYDQELYRFALELFEKRIKEHKRLFF